MLCRLHVTNFALIDDLTLELGPYLNVLSGETGAGKSIVIDAIGLLLGERASTDQVRSQEKAALIEGIFVPPLPAAALIAPVLEAAGIAAEDELFLSREVSAGGRSVARINGRLVPVSILKELGRFLVDLHGQHRHQSLLRPGEQLELLDAFGGEELGAARERMASAFQRLSRVRQELSALDCDGAVLERRLDILAHQIREIRESGPSPEEETELLRRERILAHTEKIQVLVNRAYAFLFTGDERDGLPAVVDRLFASLSDLQEAAGIDPGLSPVTETLENLYTQLQEIAPDLRDCTDRTTFDPRELETIQERLKNFNALKRKYGPSLEDVLAFAGRAEDEKSRIEQNAAHAAGLQREIIFLEEELCRIAGELREHRRIAAGGLEKEITIVLAELALAGAELVVSVTPRKNFTASGSDRIEFLFSANRGEPARPLARVISGGEMSRVMLALKTALVRQDRLPTLIFDEADAGIGGVTVNAVAEKLALLSQRHQVVCVTHSPQVAVLARDHFKLSKEISGERTLTRVIALNPEERRLEIARMLDGATVSAVSLRHVDELMKRARRFWEEQSDSVS